MQKIFNRIASFSSATCHIGKQSAMNCLVIEDNVINYLEGKLADEELVNIETHLASCTNCRDLVNDIRLTYALASKPGDIQVSDGFIEATINRLHRKEPLVIVMVNKVLKPLAVAASIGLGILIGNGELSILQNTAYTEQEAIVWSITNGADYSIWQSFDKDYGIED